MAVNEEYMTIKAAYEIFYGKTDKVITIDTIRKEVQPDDLKKKYRQMTNKFHPDLHSKESRRKQEINSAIYQDINAAYEILTGCIKSPNYVNPYIETKQMYPEYMRKKLSELEPLISEYDDKFYKAFSLSAYSILQEMRDLSNKCYEEFKTNKNPITLYELRKEYYLKMAKLKEKLRKVRDNYHQAKAYLKDKINVEKEELESFLKEIAGENYDRLNDIGIVVEFDKLKDEILRQIDRNNFVIDNIKVIFDEAFSMVNYNILQEMRDLSNRYYQAFTYHQNAVTLYELREEYNLRIAELDKKLSKVKEKYNRVKELLTSGKPIDEEELEALLKSIVEGNYRKSNDYSSTVSMTEKLNKEQDALLREISNNSSVINNLKNILIKRINQAKKVYFMALQGQKYEALKKANRSLDNAPRFEDEVKIIEEYEEISKNLSDLAAQCEKRFKLPHKMLSGLNKITLSEIDYIEGSIESIVTPKHIGKLNDPSAYIELYTDFLNNNSQLVKEESDLLKDIRRAKQKLLTKVRTKQSELASALAFIKKDSENKDYPDIHFDEEKINEDAPISELVKEEKSVNSKLDKVKKDSIKLYYKYILYYYASHEILYQMPPSIYDNYNQYLKNPDNYLIVELCYQVLKSEYEKCRGIDMTISDEDSAIIMSRMTLIDEIDRLVAPSGQPMMTIPEDLSETYEQRRIISITSLYDLYVKLSDLYSEKYPVFNPENKGHGK